MYRKETFFRFRRTDINAKRILKKTGKIALILIASLLALVILVWGVLNIAKFAIYSDYYSMKADVCDNPGLSDGFVCQGICALEEEGRIFVSGYMTDKSASRIYITDHESNSYYVSLTDESGNDFTGHAGGISVWGAPVYLLEEYTKQFSGPAMAEGLDFTNGKVITLTESASDKYIFGKFFFANQIVALDIEE